MRELLTVLIVALALLGCDSEIAGPQRVASGGAASTSAKAGKTVGAQLTGYNHTDQYIGAFYVDREWGGNIFPGAGGGSFVCCVELPVPWHSGVKATVKWDDHEGKTHSRDVEVPQYDPKTLSTFNLHFLRSGEVKVFAVRMTLRHRDYPFTGPDAELKPGVPIEKVY